ncbi:MAG: serine/threonine-protein kinase [Vicinamibacteraceae bacterium]
MVQDAGFGEEAEGLFADAIELPPAERGSFLDAQCAGRQPLRAEVESLIAAHLRADGFLAVALSDSGARESSDRFSGKTIGRFRLLDPIGEGGMGVVFRAERADGEFAQRVAIKLIDVSLRSAAAVRGFRRERQMLANLHHPHIVTLLDGGITEEGQPFLVMECIDGLPISRYCAEHRLGLAARLRLFQDVCGAVQHAHGHAIVHRDLKPANILVTADGAPKVLDFGIATLVDDPASTDADATSSRRALTPNYASPEQLTGSPATVAADIYALGVLLYELLTGGRPYDTAGKTLAEILAIVDGCVPRPSAAPAAHAAALPYPPSHLKGDLDAIVRKAMSKEPGRRYASARELSDDIDRHLRGRPVLAREPSLGYVARTLVRQHRAVAAAVTVSLVALLAAFGVSLWQIRVARAERDRAAARFNDVRQLAGALIFKIHDEVQPLPGSTPVRHLIVAEALTYLERLSHDPSVDDALRIEVAKGYHRIGKVQGLPSEPNLGDRAGAIRSLGKAVELLRPMTERPTVAREAALEFARSALSLAMTANLSGARETAFAAARDAAAVAEVQLQRSPLDVDVRRLVGSALFQSAILASDVECLPLWQRAGAVFEALLAEKPADADRRRNVALVEKYVGTYYQRRRDLVSARPHFQRALELDQQRLAAEPTKRQAQFDVAIDLGNVGLTAAGTNRLVEAAAAYQQSAALRRSLSESDPKDVMSRARLAYVEGRLAIVYAEMGRGAQALEHARIAVGLSEPLARIDSTHRASLADALAAQGRAEQASGRQSVACTTFRRSSAIVATVPRDNAAASNQAAELEARLSRHLTSCGTSERRALKVSGR